MKHIKAIYYELYNGANEDYRQLNEPECDERLTNAYDLLGEDAEEMISNLVSCFEVQGFVRGFKLATQIMAECMDKPEIIEQILRNTFSDETIIKKD